MSMTIDLEQALSLRDRGAVLIDARSPAEFAEATIPGAINIPILDDTERAEVGRLYKQTGKTEARRRGIALVAPKIPAMWSRLPVSRPTHPCRRLSSAGVVVCAVSH
jgi:tRNA 2-selenouridine synthase